MDSTIEVIFFTVGPELAITLLKIPNLNQKLLYSNRLQKNFRIIILQIKITYYNMS